MKSTARLVALVTPLRPRDIGPVTLLNLIDSRTAPSVHRRKPPFRLDRRCEPTWMAECHWLSPVLVGHFEFLEWTADNHVR